MELQIHEQADGYRSWCQRVLLFRGRTENGPDVIGLHIQAQHGELGLEAFNLSGKWPLSVLVPAPHHLL